MKEGLTTYVRMEPEFRILWTGVFENLTHSVSHRRYWRWIADDTGVSTYGKEVDDCCVVRPELKFVLDTSSFVNMSSCQTPLDCNVYTDGSKLND